jgi:hypothetical protein
MIQTAACALIATRVTSVEGQTKQRRQRERAQADDKREYQWD